MGKLLVIRGWRAVLNIHERQLNLALKEAGAALDSLSGPNDQLWPCEQWPPMVLDRGLSVGSAGGHAKIRYTLTEYVPGRRVEFTFSPMPHLSHFQGRHYFEVFPRAGHSMIRHTIDAQIDFRTWIFWKLFIERIHDALLEDAFDKVEARNGALATHASRWSLYVRFLRWLRRRQAKAKAR